MQKIKWVVLLSFLICASSFSKGLDKVDFQLSAKQWVKSNSALLQVHISATLNDADVVRARTHIQENLGKIAQGQWQITQFDRGQDESGLAKLDVQAQARVGLEQLNSVYAQASKVSRPGENYNIQQIDFKPSSQELQAAKSQLRLTLYKQVSQEIDALNQAFPGQHYTVHHLEFLEKFPASSSDIKSPAMMLNALPQNTPVVSISNEVYLIVIVDVASSRKVNSVGVNDEN